MKRGNTTEQGACILKELAGIGPFVSASFVRTQKRCGRKGCRCREEGPCHPTAHLTWKEHGKTRTLHVPQDLVEEVTQWIEEWKKLRLLIQSMSEEQRKHLIHLRQHLQD